MYNSETYLIIPNLISLLTTLTEGFLSTENDIVPGNNGLKDQILALKWIKENIQYFGGNPNSVTITGMSAGGASVHFHTMSPKSKVNCELSPIMELPLGQVQGTLAESAKGRTFLKFDGIPFARPPVGAYRFEAPEPPQPWKGTWKADTKYACIQYSNFPKLKSDPIDGNEDCLYLNVHTPRLNASLDVFVFIHGGAFMFGTGHNYEGHILVDRDIVVVSMNYRLGPLGFLSTENDIVPGNNGLKDQILALKWIKENIQYFGGNPNSVTITGMSAGGASVHFHTMSPKSKGLFHKTVSMSGCMLNPWALMEKPLERTKELSSIVGCDTENLKEMIECLKGRPEKQIVAVAERFQPYMYSPFSPFGIVVDEWSSDPLLPKHPLLLMREKAVTDIPWIISHCTAEGLYNGMDFFPKENLKHIDEHWNEVMPHILHYNFTIEQSQLDDISAKIRKEYLGNDHLTRANYHKLIDLMGDRLFNVDLDKCTRLQAAVMKSPVYHYVFGHKGAPSFTVRSGTTATIGATHGDDTVYVLKAPYADNLAREDDIAMTKEMLDLFASFTKDGKPRTVVDWPPVSKNMTDPIKFLNIDSPTSIKIEEVEEFGNRKFWDTLPFQENEHLINKKNEL